MKTYVNEEKNVNIAFDDDLDVRAIVSDNDVIVGIFSHNKSEEHLVINFIVNRDADVILEKFGTDDINLKLFGKTEMLLTERSIRCHFKVSSNATLTIGTYSSYCTQGDIYDLEHNATLRVLGELFSYEKKTLNQLTATDNSKAIIDSGEWDADVRHSAKVTFGKSTIAQICMHGNNASLTATGSCFLKITPTRKPRIEAQGFAHIILFGDVKVETINFFGSITRQTQKVKKPIIVYKKLRGSLICELLLKKGQTFQSESYTKCITDRALVKSIYRIGKNGKSYFQKGLSLYSKDFVYEVGKMVVADSYDESQDDYLHGIRFFLTEKEATDYRY